MKPIEKDELYEHLRGFLKAKGVELKEGSYSQTIQKSCSILADAINLSQRGIEKAKNEIDEKLDRMRQVIQDKTAPKPSAENVPPANPVPPPNPPKAESDRPRPSASKAKTKKAPARKRPTRRSKP